MGYARTRPGPGNECGLSLGEVSGRPAGRPHDLDDGSYFYHSSSVSIGITSNIIIVVVIDIVIIDIIIVVVISMLIMTS